MKKVIIYTRVSTDEQADRGFSLQDQEARLRKFCEIRELEIVMHYQDDASAKTFNRPEFQKMLNFIKANKRSVDGVLFVLWNRFSRNTGESYNMIKKLRDWNVECNATDQWLDLNIPESKLLLAMYLASPEVENDRRSLATRSGMRRAMKLGRWVNTPPRGYRMGRDGENKPILLCNEDAGYIKEGFELYATRLYTKPEVRHILMKKGFKISRNQFFSTLRNPLYCGKVFIPAYKDENEALVKGIHEPLIRDENLVLRLKKYTIKMLLNCNGFAFVLFKFRIFDLT